MKKAPINSSGPGALDIPQEIVSAFFAGRTTVFEDWMKNNAGHLKDFSNNIFALLRTPDDDKNTILHRAACFGQCALFAPAIRECPHEFIRLLGLQNNSGHSVLHCTAAKGSLEIFAPLMEACPKEFIELLKVSDKDGNSVLHFIAWYNQFTPLTHLMKKQPKEFTAALGVQRKDGYSALHFAAIYKKWESLTTVMEACPQEMRGLSLVESQSGKTANDFSGGELCRILDGIIARQAKPSKKGLGSREQTGFLPLPKAAQIPATHLSNGEM